MSVLIRNITVDCAEPYALAAFWAKVTGFTEDPTDPNSPTHEECLLLDPDGGPALLFIRVPEPKSVKNRLHLDLQPQERTRDEQVAYLTTIGADFVADHRNSDGTGWVLMSDPEGNEFCVERSAGERSAGERSAGERSAGERSAGERGAAESTAAERTDD